MSLLVGASVLAITPSSGARRPHPPGQFTSSLTAAGHAHRLVPSSSGRVGWGSPLGACRLLPAPAGSCRLSYRRRLAVQLRHGNPPEVRFRGLKAGGAEWPT